MSLPMLLSELPDRQSRRAFIIHQCQDYLIHGMDISTLSMDDMFALIYPFRLQGWRVLTSPDVKNVMFFQAPAKWYDKFSDLDEAMEAVKPREKETSGPSR